MFTVGFSCRWRLHLFCADPEMRENTELEIGIRAQELEANCFFLWVLGFSDVHDQKLDESVGVC